MPGLDRKQALLYPPIRRLRRPELICGLLACAVILMASGQARAERYTPLPTTSPTLVPVGDPAKDYYLLGTEPLSFEITGPGQLSGFARANFGPDSQAQKEGRVLLLGVPDLPGTVNLTFKLSTKSSYGDARDGQPSSGRRLSWQIPAGKHTLELRGDCADGSDVFVILYYDGPFQEGFARTAFTAPGATKAAKPKRSPFKTRATVGLEVIYDSNFLNNSDDYLVEWYANDNPEKFRMHSEDDMVLAPSLDLQVRRKFVAMGETRLRAKLMHWQYTFNPIKNNQEFDFYLRQNVGRGKSLELSYFYAPEQYIRELTDRAPYTPTEDPSQWMGFKFTKNVLALTYRHTLSKKLSAKILYEKNLRYYNRPFIENDIDAWEIRGNLVWKFHKGWSLSADYSYEDAAAKARDTSQETFEESDDSDASYLRDLYRLGLTWRPAFLKKFVNQIDLSGLLMLYWYPTDKELFEDPFHVGRKDKVYKITFSARRKLSKDLTATVGTRFTERTVDSPWPGDVALDKDYTKQRVWLKLTYRL